MDFKELHKRLLKKVQPDSKYSQNLKKTVKEFTSIIKKEISPLKLFVGGSYAKGSWLPKIKDVDLFILFPYKKYKNKDLSKILESKLVKFNYEKIHGSRDYFKINYKRLKFEIVPILKIEDSSQAVNITDISPLHVKWVNSHTKVKNEIRILKLFLKVNNLYGAESYIKGFSGYVCEILICYYKSFLNLIKDTLNWQDRKIIDVEKHYKNEDEIIKTLNPSKTSPLIIIDPVQKIRNAGAAISKESYDKFKEKAKNLLKKPKLFQKEKLSKENLEKKYKSNIVVFLEVKPLEGKDDVIGSKLLKVLKYISERSKQYGFEIITKGWDYDTKKTSQMYFIFKGDIKRYFEKQGPFINQKQNVEDFKQKHKQCFQKENRIFVKERRDFTSPTSFILNIIQEDYIKDKVKSIRLI